LPSEPVTLDDVARMHTDRRRDAVMKDVDRGSLAVSAALAFVAFLLVPRCLG